jgi:ATP-dependent DNA helicase RecQ
VIDEAHCVVQWGDNFRENYGELYKLKLFNRNVNVLAMTATALRKMQIYIAAALMMTNWQLVHTSVNRPNIYISVQRRDPSTGANHLSENSVFNIVEPLLTKLSRKKLDFKKTVCTASFNGVGCVGMQ